MIRAEPGWEGTHHTVAPASLTSETLSAPGTPGGSLPETARRGAATGPAAILSALLGGPTRPRVSTAATVMRCARAELNLTTYTRPRVCPTTAPSRVIR